MEINKTIGTNDEIVGLTSVNYGRTLAVNNLSGTLTTNDTSKLFDSAAHAGEFASITAAAPAAGLVWNSSTLATNQFSLPIGGPADASSFV